MSTTQPANISLTPRVIFVDKDKNIAPGTVYGPVTYDHFIFECCVDGGGKVLINGREFPISVGVGYALLPGDNIHLIADSVKSRTCVWCAIVGEPVASVLAAAGISSNQPYIPPASFAEVKACITDLLNMRDDLDGGADLRRTACVYRMLAALLRDRTAVDKNLWVNKAIGIMETKYPFPLTVADLAAAVGLDRAYFSTLFKSVTGLTPYTYLTNLRVRKACALLTSTDLPISSIAEAVGIDPQNFACIFRRVTGASPRDFLTQNKR